MKAIRRIVSFFAKEVNYVRRQPLLLMSLILGPFLILALFGLGYTGERPTLRTALVVPAEYADDPLIGQLRENMGAAFEVGEVFTNEEEAVAALRRGEYDVVEIFPLAMTEVYTTGQRADIRIIYNEIDPLLRDWIEYLSYTQVNELNNAMLRNYVGEQQGQAETFKDYIARAKTQIAEVRTNLSDGRREEALGTIRTLRANGGMQLIALALAQNQDPDATSNFSNFQASLSNLETSLAAGGEMDRQMEQLDAIDRELDELNAVADRIQTIDPVVVVSPMQSKTDNLVPDEALGNGDPSVSYVRFYAPAVVALLLQHMLVTLAGLSLVRERMLGTIEVFRVAPLDAIQVMFGKLWGYIIFALVIVGALMPLLYFGLGIPFPLARLGEFALITMLVTVASISWGFLISAIVSSDSQAVQFSMLMLLMSVFFSGFFIPLKSFIPELQWLAGALPVTHGIQAFQDILLLSQAPDPQTYAWLAGTTIVIFLASWLIFRRQFSRS